MIAIRNIGERCKRVLGADTAAMSSLCRACQHFEAPSERGVYLCQGCTRLLLKQLQNPRLGDARRVRAQSYGQACDLCGEYENRWILAHPEWGRICEVDIREAAELHRV